MIHKQLNRILKKQKISGYRLSLDTGITQVQIWKYRKGKATPRMQNLVKIANALDVRTDDLLK